MSPEVLTERLPLPQVGPADRDAWSALAERALQPNLYFEPECVLPAAAHLAGGSRAELLVVRRGTRWLACVPVLRRPKWSDLYVPGLRTWIHPYSLLSTPLLDRDEPEAAAAGLVRGPRRWPGRAFLALEAMGDGAVADAILAARPAGGRTPVVHNDFERACVRRRPENTYRTEGVKPRRRRDRERTRRVLERETGAAPVLVDVSDDPTALDRFLEMEGAGWKRETGTALVLRSGDERFTRELWAGFRALGRAHLFELRSGSRTLAAVICLSGGAELHGFRTTHDESLRRGDPGVHLLSDVIDWFHDQPGLTLFDADGERDNRMLNALFPDRRRIVSAVVPAAGPAGTVAEAWLDVHRRRRPGATAGLAGGGRAMDDGPATADA